MKKKMLLMMLALTVSVALIVGATMAWFTAEDETENAVFQAGTVKIEAERNVDFDDEYGNINPGDCKVVKYNIENTGTKSIELRAVLNLAWQGQGELPLDNIYIVPQYGSDWVLYQLDDEKGPEHPIYAYYMGGPVDTGDDVDLELVVYFDGARTGNEYQDMGFVIKGEFNAVQATNGAPEAEWGSQGWTAVKVDGESFEYEGWPLVKEDGLKPEDLACYDAPEQEEEEEEEEKENEPEPFTDFSFKYKRVSNKMIEVEISDAENENGVINGLKTITLTVNRYDGETMSKDINVNFEDGEAEFWTIFSNNISSLYPNAKITIDGVTKTGTRVHD